MDVDVGDGVGDGDGDRDDVGGGDDLVGLAVRLGDDLVGAGVRCPCVGVGEWCVPALGVRADG